MLKTDMIIISISYLNKKNYPFAVKRLTLLGVEYPEFPLHPASRACSNPSRWYLYASQ